MNKNWNWKEHQMAEISRCREVAAIRKVEEWLSGVTNDSFIRELKALVAEKTSQGEYIFRSDDEKSLALTAAESFFLSFSRKLIKLSDGRFVYFAPDDRARNRGVSNSRAWAEYAFHAISSGGKQIPGKGYTYRYYSKEKTSNIELIDPTIRNEHCFPYFDNADPFRDSVRFFGTTPSNKRFDVITRLDEFGNIDANLSEVTIIMTGKNMLKNPPPKIRPLTEAVEAVAIHQAAGYSPSTT